MSAAPFSCSATNGRTCRWLDGTPDQNTRHSGNVGLELLGNRFRTKRLALTPARS
jgi:hypothetical protein